MSRGLLNKKVRQDILRNLPDTERARRRCRTLQVETIAIQMGSKSAAPIAAVCVNDLDDTLLAINHALFEARAHHHYYTIKAQPPNGFSAIFFSRYYLDDAALRLYSSGEHLANAIRHLYEIPPQDLKKFRVDRTSMQVAIAKYMKANQPKDPLTKALQTLGKSSAWTFTMDYRNNWVHQQPPSISGLGLVRHRKTPWTIGTHGKPTLTIYGGEYGGDKPKHQIAELQAECEAAVSAFLDCTHAFVDRFQAILVENGAIIGADGQLSAVF